MFFLYMLLMFSKNILMDIIESFTSTNKFKDI